MAVNKSLIPNSITLTNAACGTTAIFLSQIELGIILLSIAMILDLLDGFMAKKIDASSELGKELDSLADAISFGVAPAFLYYLHFKSQIALILGVLYTINAIFRLAKFNTLDASKSFNGLPSPAAAGVVLSLLLIDVNVRTNIPIHFLIIFPAALMNMNISFFSLKAMKSNLRLIGLILIFTVIAGMFNVLYAPLVLFLSYIVISIVKNVNIDEEINT